jgi:adenine deaminase
MKVMLRLGSSWFDVAAQIKAITEHKLDSRHFLLCTDDSHSGTLVHDGHMDRVLRHVVAQGVAPITAIQMMTLNTAEHFGVSRDVGQIAPGRYADIVLASDLTSFRAEMVIAAGEVIAEGGTWQIEFPIYSYPDEVKHSVMLKQPLQASDFAVLAPAGFTDGATVTANVIGVIENQAPTRHLRFTLAVRNGEVQSDSQRDVCKLALVERHRGTGEVQMGFVHGFGFDQPCAVASTVAHDSHHMIVAGTDDGNMALAANTLAECGGGLCVVLNGEARAVVPMPIAGLMSDQHAEIVAAQAENLLAGFRDCGCMLNSPNMQLSLLALVVIPELRISDLGLVDVTKFEVIEVIESQGPSNGKLC